MLVIFSSLLFFKLASAACTVIVHKNCNKYGECNTHDIIGDWDGYTTSQPVMPSGGVSGIEIDGDCDVRLYSESYYRGTSTVLTKSNCNLCNPLDHFKWSNQVQSMKIMQPAYDEESRRPSEDDDMPSVDASCIVTGYEAFNKAKYKQLRLESVLECQSECAKASRCKYFNFQDWTGLCWFYDSKPHVGLDWVWRARQRGDTNYFGPDTCPKHKEVDTNTIICPFLATLVNEGALPVRDSYTKFELEGTTVQAGIPEMIVEDHVHGGNFFHNPSGVQNIFNMEGAVNEHITSTGIHDCATDYSNCPESTKHDPVGKEMCPGAKTGTCNLPRPDIFEKFWDHTDANDDKFIDLDEMLNDANDFPVIDVNDVTGRGTITGGFQSLIRLMGVDDEGVHQEANGNTKMDKPTMQRINIDRRFPEHYVFPYIAGGNGFVQLGDWRFGPVSEEMHFSFSHRKTDRSIVFSASGREYNSGGFNFRLWDEMLASGQYPSNVGFGSDLTFGDWRIGYIDNQYLSIEKKADNGVVFEAAGQTVPHHPGGEKVWDDKGDEVAKFAYFGDRFLQLGNFRLADAGNERFTISHSAFRDRGITMLSNGDVVEGIFDYDNDVWDRPVEGTCMNMSCKLLEHADEHSCTLKYTSKWPHCENLGCFSNKDVADAP